MTTTSLAGGPGARSLARPDQASGGRVALGVAIAVLEVTLIGAGVALAFAVGDTGAIVTAVIIAVALLVLDFAWWMRAGYGLAWRIAGISLLARTDDAPLGFGRVLPMPPTWVAVTRGRRHPVDVRLDPIVLADPDPIRSPRQPRTNPLLAGASALTGTRAGARAARESQANTPVGEDPRGAPPATDPGSGMPVLPPGMQPARAEQGSRSHRGPLRVTVDGQSRHVLTGTAVVGRRPVAESDGESTITVTDLTRTLSKNHLRLDVERDGAVFVTDLGSTNGSAVRQADGTIEQLIPHVPVELDLHDTVTLGDHRLTFSNGGGV